MSGLSPPSSQSSQNHSVDFRYSGSELVMLYDYKVSAMGRVEREDRDLDSLWRTVNVIVAGENILSVDCVCV